MALRGQVESILGVALEPKNWIAPINGLRTIAALLVLACHASALPLPYGPAGSAFLLTKPFVHADGSGVWEILATFYIRRAFRILPMYAVYVVTYVGRVLPVLHLSPSGYLRVASAAQFCSTVTPASASAACQALLRFQGYFRWRCVVTLSRSGGAMLGLSVPPLLGERDGNYGKSAALRICGGGNDNSGF